MPQAPASLHPADHDRAGYVLRAGLCGVCGDPVSATKFSKPYGGGVAHGWCDPRKPRKENPNG